MIKQGKSKDTAVLRTLINTQAQNFATKRLLKDLNIIEKESIPTVGVTARPLEHDLFVWHANIRGPVGTPYEGGIFHFQLLIPESYPHQPPKIDLFTELPHPNVFGNSICLDLLQPRKPQDKNKQSGWSSAYTIQSILLQLSAFLFEEQITEKKEKQLAQIKKAIQTANNFKCTTKNCKHGGKLSLWPQFNTKESDEQQFINKQTEQELLEQQFICFHTKLSYKKPQIPQYDDETKIKQESCLGILLNVSKVPRTGQIKQAVPSLDYVSIKAFLNEGLKWDSLNLKYTHWLPLYFGKTDNKERVLHLLQRSLSMIMTNNTKRFKPEFVLEVFPKIIQSIVHGMMAEKTHASIRCLRVLAQIHALWLLCMEEWPQLYQQVDAIIYKFITDEKSRTKEFTPNLGILFNLLYVSKKYTFEDLVQSYTTEQLDRQVFWLLKEIPELADEKLEGAISATKRVEITFKQQSTSFQMVCFQYIYLTYVVQPLKTQKEILERFDKNYCLLTTGIENGIQEKIFEAFKRVVNYDGFYDFIGQQKKSIEELNLLLKQSVKNSKEKKYHGTVEEMNQLPPVIDQVKQYQKKYSKLQDFYVITQEEQDKKQIKYYCEEKQNVDWKQELCKRWDWIDEQLKWNTKLNATELAQQSNYRMLNGFSLKPEDRLYNKIETLRNQYHCIKYQTYFPQHTWQQLYMKLDFEQFLLQFDSCPDFQSFYQKVTIVKGQLLDLVLVLIHIKTVQSGYYYITAAIEQFTKLVRLTLTGQNQLGSIIFPIKAAKSIYKGLNNLSKQQNSLQILEISKISFAGNQLEITESIFGVLNLFQNQLKSLTIENTDMLTLSNAAKTVGAIITSFRQLEYLKLKGSIRNADIAKEIADGLMRAKQLVAVDFSQNILATEKGLAIIVYNLSFSPKLTFLDISGCGSITSVELVESLFKLLRITASLEHLNLESLYGLNLTQEFFIALGENRTLKTLNLNDIGEFNDENLKQLGKAIEFNAQKGGQLTIINLNKDGINYQKLKKIIESMAISNYDNEVWYGDENKASKMSGDDYKKIFKCNLQTLDVKIAPFNSNFDINYFKSQYKAKNQLQNIFVKNPNLIDLNFAEKQFNKKDMDLLSQMVHQKAIKLKVLNLSRNNLNKEGAKILSTFLESNTTLEFIDLSGNKIGVSGGKSIALALRKNQTLKQLNLFFNLIGFDGAKEFGITFKINNTLEFIDLGNNRIRNKGLLAITEGLSENKQSKVSTLGLRFNFLSEDGILNLIKKTNLQEIFIKNNSITDYGLYCLKKGYDELKSNIRIDLFSKLNLIEESRLERTAWIQPIFEIPDIIAFFNKFEVGVILDARFRKGQKYKNHKLTFNFNFVEFADPNSLNRALALASTNQAIIDSKAFRIYKAGTGTFIYQKKSAKEKKAESSKTNILQTNITTSIATRGRGRGRGRDMGRGIRRDMGRGLRRDMGRGRGGDMGRGLRRDMGRGLRRDMERGRGGDMERGRGRDMERGIGGDIRRDMIREIRRSMAEEIRREMERDIKRGGRGRDMGRA